MTQTHEATTELDRIRAIPDAADRAKAAQQYVQRHNEAAAEGTQVRNAAAVEMLATVGPSVTAQHLGLSKERIKQLRAAAARD